MCWNRLESDKKLSVDYLVQITEETSTPNSKTRLRLCRAYRLLLKLADLEGDEQLAAIKGNYSANRTKDLVIPSDDDIFKYWDEMPTIPWQVVYGLMACYGLRPSEVFFTDLGYLEWEDGRLRDEIVVESSKTWGNKPKTRQVWPICPTEWMERLRSLGGELPNIKLDRERHKIGRSVTERFGYSIIPYTPYALRHGYAVRGILSGLQDSICAKWCGHSLKLHAEVYQRHIDERHSKAAYQQMLQTRLGDR